MQLVQNVHIIAIMLFLSSCTVAGTYMTSFVVGWFVETVAKFPGLIIWLIFSSQVLNWSLVTIDSGWEISTASYLPWASS